MKRTVLLVDDEAPARRRLRRLLERYPELEIAAEAGDVAGAVKTLDSAPIDLIFLDIQMPQGCGFELFQRTTVTADVIFVTAYDQHAVRAFEVNALDYLLKPIEPARLAEALRRQRPPPARHLTLSDSIAVGGPRGIRFLSLRDVAVLRAAGDYSELVMRDGTSHLTSSSLTRWSQRLPEATFVRVHRSTIVALDYLRELRLVGAGTYHAIVAGVAEPLPVSRRHLTQLRQRFGL